MINTRGVIMEKQDKGTVKDTVQVMDLVIHQVIPLDAASISPNVQHFSPRMEFHLVQRLKS